MVNLTNDIHWNVDKSEIGRNLREAISEVHKICRNFLPIGTPSKRSGLIATLNAIDAADVRAIESWPINKAKIFLNESIRDTGKYYPLSSIDEAFATIDSNINSRISFRSFVRLVVVWLWSKEILLAPHDYTAPVNLDEIFDAVVVKAGNKMLAHVRSMNKLSSIEYEGDDKLEDRNRRSNHWFRLLLNTSFYQAENITLDNAATIMEAGSGKRSQLGRYYPADFLLSMSIGVDAFKEELSELIAQFKEAGRERVIEAQREAAKVRRVDPSWQPRSEKNLYIQSCLDYLEGADKDITLSKLISDVVGTHNLMKTFGGLNADFDSYIYPRLPAAVVSFAKLVSRTFAAFVKSTGVEKGQNHQFSLNLMLFYITVYLPRFFTDRDGNLDSYPKTLNDFNCSYYVTRDSLLDEVLHFDKEPPMTLVSFVGIYANTFNWVGPTHYSRLLYIEKYFEYLVNNDTLIPNSDAVKNSFSQANYPKTSKSSGTNKKPIPRRYFATFVSLLYTLEYLVNHLNAMANGITPGYLNGSLKYLTRADLEEQHIWSKLWGGRGFSTPLIDLSLLNYTPIYLHEGRYRPLRKCHKFYRIATHPQGEGRPPKTLATPHQVRTTLLMCETGIRQKHLLWLDKDRYDCFVDRSFNHILAPLLVNTDKSHAEWTAIVSERAIKICDRQRDFYDNCGDPSFDEDLWYGESEGSKFGKFKPLFRQPTTESSWDNRSEFANMLWTLQYIIREDLKDKKLPSLVSLKNDDKTKEITEFTEEELVGHKLTSVHTPHALRAGFVSEAIRFLPPSLIGEFMTGQTEALVWYYTVTDPEDFMSHQQLMANYLSKNLDKISRGEAPELAEMVAKVNRKLMAAIEVDPAAAIEKYKLMSLTGISQDKTGLKLLLAKKYTKLAFTPTHICPFNNKCPKEVVEQFGLNRPHALCPYAIRGLVHLPGVSAAKDKCAEQVNENLQKIKNYKARPKSAQNADELEDLNTNHDNNYREGAAYEAIEQQLYAMSQSEDKDSYIVQERDTLINHFKKVKLNEGEHLMKRLIDVRSFPDLDSKAINRKFAYARNRLLLQDGNINALFADDPEQSEAMLFTSQLKSMMDVKQLEVKDIFRIATSTTKVSQEPPRLPFLDALSVKAKDNDYDCEEETGNV